MPRSPRVVSSGAPHHIVQRGNARQDVFVTDELRRLYLDLLAEHASRNRVRVLAYCLMTNHVHLVVVPETPIGLAHTFRHAHGRFSQFWNTKFQRTGHLWQNRFYSCPVEEPAVWRVVRYIEQNPVRAGMIESAASYPWSSAAAHVRAEASLLLDQQWWGAHRGPSEWAAVLHDADEDAAAIRAATFNGRPYGSGEWVRELEVKLGRSLARRPGGRPRNIVPSGNVSSVPGFQ